MQEVLILRRQYISIIILMYILVKERTIYERQGSYPLPSQVIVARRIVVH